MLWPVQSDEDPIPLAGKLMPKWVPDHWWQIISVDLITELPWIHGYDAIMVVVDWLSNCTNVVLTTSNVTASWVVQLFRDHVWKLHGLPEEVIRNWGTHFILNFTCSLSQLLGIKIAVSTAVTSECTALLSQKSGFRGVLDSGFSSCAAPTYYCRSEYF